MSRRREAADLARALALSTQEARTISKLSPHTLSSSKSTTQDSKDMELKAVAGLGAPPRVLTDVQLPMRYGGAETVRPGDVMRPPSAEVGWRSSESSHKTGSGGSRSDPIASASMTNPAGQTSAIQSFTPSHSFDRPILVPPSSHTVPRLPSTSFSSQANPVASSRPSTDKARNSNHKSQTDSSGSSHRPLFSPTQVSDRPPPSKARREAVTYGRSGRSSVSPIKGDSKDGKSGLAGSSVLDQSGKGMSSSPPKAQRKKVVIELSSDNEVEEEVEEEDRAGRAVPSTTKSHLEAVLFLPKRVETKTATTPKAISKGKDRDESPDPFDSNLSRETSVAEPSASRVDASERKKAGKSSKTVGLQLPVNGLSTGLRRVSSRVRDNEEKKQKDKEERRAKKRADRAAKEEAARRSAAGDVGEIGLAEEDRRKGRNAEHRTGMPSSRDIPPNTALGDTEEVETGGSAKDLKLVLKSPRLVDGGEEHVDDDPKPVNAVSKGKKRKMVTEDGEDEYGAGPEIEEDEADSPVKKGKERGKAKGRESAKGRGRVKARDKDKTAGEAVEVVEMPDGRALSPSETSALGQAVKDVSSVLPVSKEAGQNEKIEKRDASPIRRTSPDKQPEPARPPLRTTTSNFSTPESSHRASPGPLGPDGKPARPGGISWKTARSDLSSVLARYPTARQSGMSKRYRIAPLHAKIGPPAKALPPPPLKPTTRKKDETDDEDEAEEEEESDGDGGVRKKVKGKGIEWYMVED